MNERIHEEDLLKRLTAGSVLLRPLEIKSLRRKADHIDAWLELGFPADRESFPFLVEAKSQNTPLAVHGAIAQAKRYVANCPQSDRKPQPMIYVPYLSPERLDDLEREQISGVDMCGNGLIIVPGRIYILRRGYANTTPQSKPLNNPYAGRSSLVARMLLSSRHCERVKDLHVGIHLEGASISLAQVSKAVSALEDDLILWRMGIISLREPALLLDRLGQAFEKIRPKRQQAVRLVPGTDWVRALNMESRLKWAVTGESSAARYATLGQSGPKRIAVSDLNLAISQINCTPEPIPNFADLELLETDDPGVYFQNQIDDKGMRWASPLQAWLELQAGDARQQEAAKAIRTRIMSGVKHAKV
jgi:hypothetical protein